ncbi:MAG: M48 family metallopeptidase [Eubacterium sp.]|nr:M48 family metallopeptidase [Eubacterium sp.]
MKLDERLFLHDSDCAALDALKAIPGFHQLMKAFMKVWSEQQFKLINMSTNLRLGEDQMPEVYHLLPPICEKLGIEEPELYVELDVRPNAYTYGDTKPFIVLTSGLFETIPAELIPTVIAHECGHIACHHTLYTTMGRLILTGASQFVSGIGSLALYTIQIAFAYWMRCSEYSADRAAILCDGSADKIMNMCMRFAGFDKDITEDANFDSFMKQAEEYRAMVNDSKWNKTLEFILVKDRDHPFNAVRAYEAREWANTEQFRSVFAYMSGKGEMPKITKGPDEPASQDIPADPSEPSGEIVSDNVSDTSDELYPSTQISMFDGYKCFIGKDTEVVKKVLSDLGFTNITVMDYPISRFNILTKPNTVAKISIADNEEFTAGTVFEFNARIVLYSYK